MHAHALPGEMERLRIATQLRAGLFGVIYVLDEPTTGLHPADVELLTGQFHRLVDAGNTVVVVEHEMDVVVVVEHNMDEVAAADWGTDLGPAGGDAGGRIIAAGTPAVVARSKESRTAPCLAAVLGG